ncbi:MAG: tRNA pseudouridine(38-40) synthase TruA [Candidatus Anammoxibacter sp.]
MRNIKLSIEYDGTSYAGWQKQENATTVEGILEVSIGKVVGEKIVLCGSGRTDSGVHARAQIANFKTSSQIPSSRFPFAINANLPKDIVVREAHDVDDTFHSRFSAKTKVYQYTVYNSDIRTALNRDFCYFYNISIDFVVMGKGAQLLRGKHDFSSFKTGALPGENNVRELKRLEIRRDGKYVYFTFEADGFLRYMVRRIVGVLLELGRGRISIKDLSFILASKNPSLGVPTAPAKGLCLMEVGY